MATIRRGLSYAYTQRLVVSEGCGLRYCGRNIGSPANQLEADLLKQETLLTKENT
jgi:hypothetical protein